MMSLQNYWKRGTKVVDKIGIYLKSSFRDNFKGDINERYIYQATQLAKKDKQTNDLVSRESDKIETKRFEYMLGYPQIRTKGTAAKIFFGLGKDEKQ